MPASRLPHNRKRDTRARRVSDTIIPIVFVGFGGHPVSHAVEILGRSEAAAHEALIVGVTEPAAGERRVELVLAGGEPAHAALDAFALEWLGVRPGDIVWVRRLSAAPMSRARA